MTGLEQLREKYFNSYDYIAAKALESNCKRLEKVLFQPKTMSVSIKLTDKEDEPKWDTRESRVIEMYYRFGTKKLRYRVIKDWYRVGGYTSRPFGLQEAVLNAMANAEAKRIDEMLRKDLFIKRAPRPKSQKVGWTFF